MHNFVTMTSWDLEWKGNEISIEFGLRRTHHYWNGPLLHIHHFFPKYFNTCVECYNNYYLKGANKYFYLLKRKRRHFDEIFITGCSSICQNDNLCGVGFVKMSFPFQFLTRIFRVTHKTRQWKLCLYLLSVRMLHIIGQWARWRLKSLASRLFAQLFVRVQIKESNKAPRHWPLWGESIGDRWIPLKKGQ